ncbi:MAG: VCBS repeat-containing protein [Candidatus Kerfeldbacteria bacterium]|nr:VCBS repeat-containing protein [Candidatus Kerfeldbacteria bacterium]
MRLAIISVILCSLPTLAFARTLLLENYQNILSYSTQYQSSSLVLGRHDASGDFTGDGINDLVYSDPNDSGQDKRTGMVRLLPGNTTITDPTKADTSLLKKGSVENERQGASLNYIGDINGDGFDEIFSSGKVGDAYLYFGASDPTNRSETALTSLYDFNCCFEALGPADINGDSQDDLVIVHNDFWRTETAVYIAFGPIDPTTALTITDVADVTIPNLGRGGRTYSHSATGDINGDGYDDLLLADDTTYPDKAVYQIVFGSTSLPTTVTAFDATIASKYELTDVLTGDVNGDGLTDILCRQASSKGFYLILGSADLAGEIGLKTAAVSTIPYTLGEPAEIADLNADGLDDIVIVKDDLVGSHNQYGSGYIVNGRTDWPASLTEQDARSQFIGGGMYEEIPVISAGDIDGDQKNDLIVGSPYYQAGQPARLYLLTSRDQDSDQFTGLSGDCDDTISTINPDERDDTGDQVNNDCDGYTDEAATFSPLQNGKIVSVELLPYQQLVITYADDSKQSIFLSEYSNKSNKYYNAFHIPETKFIAVMNNDYGDGEELYVMNGYSGKTVARVVEHVSNAFQTNGILHLDHTTAYGQELLIGANHYEVGAGDYYFPTEVYLFSVDTVTGQIIWRDTVAIDQLYRQVEVRGKTIQLLIKGNTVAQFKITADLTLEQTE